jgi:flavin-dependent dehydrogenase
VTIRATELLPFDIDPVVERVAYGMRLSLRQSNGFVRRSPTKLTLLTQRRRLDAFLVERALETGVTLRQRAAITGIDRHSTHVVVHTNGETFKGATLVAADGANGPTARMAGIDARLLHGIALEGNITPNGDFPTEWEDMLGLNLGGIPGGYGWMFPKGDHLNIGIGGWKYTAPSLRGRLGNLAAFYGFEAANMRSLRGHHLPMRGPSGALVNGNVLLVGDAAGLVDPLTGEGIYSAIWSGRTAARHLALYVAGEVPDLDDYRAEVERDLVPNLRVARQFHDLLHLAPGLYIRVERLKSIVWGLFCRLLRGEQTYVQVMQAHPNLATLVYFVSDLVRVTPFLQRMAGLQDPTPPQRFFLGDVQH